MILCASPRCRPANRHTTTCQDETCRGCQPRRAADGRNLCETCTRWLGEDAVKAVAVYQELAHRLARGAAAGQKVAGTRDRGTELNEKAVAARTLIRHRLVSWTLLVAEERGLRLPADDVGAMGDYLRLHAVWLSAHPAAGDCADEIAELAQGWPRATAYPDPATVVPLGACPHPGCAGQLAALVRRTDSLLPSEIICRAEDAERAAHRWEWGSEAWRALMRDLAERTAA